MTTQFVTEYLDNKIAQNINLIDFDGFVLHVNELSFEILPSIST